MFKKQLFPINRYTDTDTDRDSKSECLYVDGHMCVCSKED